MTMVVMHRYRLPRVRPRRRCRLTNCRVLKPRTRNAMPWPRPWKSSWRRAAGCRKSRPTWWQIHPRSLITNTAAGLSESQRRVSALLKKPAVAAGFFMGGRWRSVGAVPAGQQRRQLGQAANLRIWLPLRFPGLARRVVPDRPQAGLLGPGDIIPRVIADMHRRAGRDIPAAHQGFVEQPRIRLGDADVFGTQRKAEIVGEPETAHVGIAIGDHPQGKGAPQGLQGRFDLRKYLDLVPGVDKHLEALIRQF